MAAEVRDREATLLSILQHPLRKRLLRFYVEAEGTLSPKELTLLANDPKISNVGYHVRVLAEKGAVGRRRLRDHLAGQPDQDSTAILFPNEAGAPLDPSNLRPRVPKPLVRQAGAP